MAALRDWHELSPGGVVEPASAPRPITGGWRTGERPQVDRERCVNCLLCWLYCPDDAVTLDGDSFAGFELDYCKGCAICAVVCPVDAIEMVAE